MNPIVEVEIAGAVGVVTLNRPEAMNALSIALRRAFAEEIARLDGDPSVRAIVVTGAGERAFSAGVDLKELASRPLAETLGDGGLPARNPALAVTSCRKPVIGAVNGVAATGGFELALACDMLIASPAARFADTHAHVGLAPIWGLSQRLSRQIGVARAKWMSFTGAFIDAQRALAWGLVVEVVAQDQLRPAALRLAADIALAEPGALAAYKGLIDRGYGLGLDKALALEHASANAFNAQAKPEEIGARIGGLIARNRS